MSLLWKWTPRSAEFSAPYVRPVERREITTRRRQLINSWRASNGRELFWYFDWALERRSGVLLRFIISSIETRRKVLITNRDMNCPDIFNILISFQRFCFVLFHERWGRYLLCRACFHIAIMHRFFISQSII